MAATTTEIAIGPLPVGYDRWDQLLDLIMRSFAYMDGVIDPPSSAHRLTAASLAEKAADETVFVALDGDNPVGCVFLAERGHNLYLGKLAVEPAFQRAGLGRRLVAEAERETRRRGLRTIELQTRIELTGNQHAFARLGFVETGRTAHAGFDRPTTVNMRKVLD